MTVPREHGRKGMTAAELIARNDADPAYQARMAAREANLREFAAMLSQAEQPVVEDLASVGVLVDSVWDLVNTSTPYPNALPVLMKHLERGSYPDRILAGIARALAVKPASSYWSKLADMYRKAVGRGEREGLAVALAASARKENAGALIALVADSRLDDTRNLLIQPLARLGGDEGRAALEHLADDPAVGKEVSRVLRRRRRS